MFACCLPSVCSKFVLRQFPFTMAAMKAVKATGRIPHKQHVSRVFSLTVEFVFACVVVRSFFGWIDAQFVFGLRFMHVLACCLPSLCVPSSFYDTFHSHNCSHEGNEGYRPYSTQETSQNCTDTLRVLIVFHGNVENCQFKRKRYSTTLIYKKFSHLLEIVKGRSFMGAWISSSEVS